MIIQSVRVQNFRSIEDAILDCDRLTVLVGPNGAGKSCFLRALELFYTPNATYSPDDFYNREVETRSVIITVTFSELTDQERQDLQSHIDGDTLVVQKEITWPPSRTSQRYYGSTRQNPDFLVVRQAATATEKRAAYAALIESGNYPELPRSLPSAAAIEQTLAAWEQAHPDRCQRVRDTGQFFGFREVGQARLERYTHFILVPAVREAAEDATEGKGKVLSELMDLVVRSALARSEEFRLFQEEIQSKYAALVDPTRLVELRNLADQLSETLRTFVPQASVELTWQQAMLPELRAPNAAVRLIEDGFPAPVDRTGHGLQRAFIMTMLQHLARVRAQGEPGVPPDASPAGSDNEGGAVPRITLPDLILGIEEPELFQHPNRQRHLARVLMNLAYGSIPGVARRTQVIYCTHSPLLVDLERFPQIRVVRKESADPGRPRRTRVFQVGWDVLAGSLEAAYGKDPGSYTGEGLRIKAHTTMNPWANEGFFADVVVLVEGETDRAALLAVAVAKGLSLESMGVCVIPCQCKNNLSKPAVIFSALGIPTYPVWDNDRGNPKAPADNRALLHLCGAEPMDYPTGVHDRFACFDPELEACLTAEIGSERLAQIRHEVLQGTGLTADDARKNPAVMYAVVQEAYDQGATCPTLEAIIDNVLALVPTPS